MLHMSLYFWSLVAAVKIHVALSNLGVKGHIPVSDNKFLLGIDQEVGELIVVPSLMRYNVLTKCSLTNYYTLDLLK